MKFSRFCVNIFERIFQLVQSMISHPEIYNVAWATILMEARLFKS